MPELLPYGCIIQIVNNVFLKIFVLCCSSWFESCGTQIRNWLCTSNDWIWFPLWWMSPGSWWFYCLWGVSGHTAGCMESGKNTALQAPRSADLWYTFHLLVNVIQTTCSRPFLFVGLCITVLLIHRRINAATLVRCSVGPSFTCSCTVIHRSICPPIWHSRCLNIVWYRVYVYHTFYISYAFIYLESVVYIFMFKLHRKMSIAVVGYHYSMKNWCLKLCHLATEICFIRRVEVDQGKFQGCCTTECMYCTCKLLWPNPGEGPVRMGSRWITYGHQSAVLWWGRSPCQWRLVCKLCLWSKNLAFKILLVLANAPGLLQDFSLAHPNWVSVQIQQPTPAAAHQGHHYNIQELLHNMFDASQKDTLLLYVNARNLHHSQLHGKYEGFHGRTKVHSCGWLLEELLTRCS